MLRNQTLSVLLPAGTSAGLRELNVTLDQEYARCKGVSVYENSDGGAPNYKIGLKDASRTYQEPTHKNDWVCGPEVAPDYRHKSLPLPTNGNQLTVQVDIPKALTSDLSFDIVFKLADKR